MTLKPLFLQVASRDEHFQGMVDDHSERHKAYCSKWDYKYLVDDFALTLTTKLSGFHWMKLILQHMKSGEYSHIFWVDGDTFVADFKHDMRETLPHWAYFAATIHPYSWTVNQPVFHINAGMMYFKCCPKAISFLEELVRNEHMYQDNQAGINWMLIGGPDSDYWQNGFRILPNSWNNNAHDQPQRPIVAAFHGCFDPHRKRKFMRNLSACYPWSYK